MNVRVLGPKLKKKEMITQNTISTICWSPSWNKLVKLRDNGSSNTASMMKVQNNIDLRSRRLITAISRIHPIIEGMETLYMACVMLTQSTSCIKSPFGVVPFVCTLELLYHHGSFDLNDSICEDQSFASVDGLLNP